MENYNCEKYKNGFENLSDVDIFVWYVANHPKNEKKETDKKFFRKTNLFTTNENKILNFLKNNKGGYCDDCLSEILGIHPRQQVNQICRKLHDRQKMTRIKSEWCKCFKIKTTNQIK